MILPPAGMLFTPPLDDVRAARSQLLREGRRLPLVLSGADLARFGWTRWDGLIYGIACAPEGT